ncbi:MAG: aldose epimerase family protein [Solirubrobacteraceae bacterium]
MLHLSRGGRRLLAFSSATLIAIALLAVASAGSLAHQRSTHHGVKAAHWKSGGGSISSVPWGTANGTPVNLYTLTNGHGMTVNITNYGGVVQSIWVRDRWGTLRNVALGFPSLSDYVNDFTQGANSTSWPLPGGSGDTYFGAIIGRYANRIANAKFTMSCTGCDNNGMTYTLDANNGVNSLHGGYLGWNTVVWSASTASSSQGVSLVLTHSFPAGEGCTIPPSTSCTGYPAPVTATVTYTLTRDNALQIGYKAVNTAPAGGDATVINLTNHTYFNLGGEASGSVFDQLLQINANQYTPINENLIPVGFEPVAGTAFDFTRMKPIGQDIRNPVGDNGGQPFTQLVIAHGYDHNFVLNGSGYRLAAVAQDPKDGIAMWTYTDQPGVQLYTGNFLVGDLTGTSGHIYRQTDAFTLETQHYPDSPNHIGQTGWPSVVLNAGSTFATTTSYKFSTVGRGHYAHDTSFR